MLHRKQLNGHGAGYEIRDETGITVSPAPAGDHPGAALPMPISRIHSYLVHPSKHEEDQPKIGGVEGPHTGKLFAMLKRLEYEALTECEIEIMFRASSSGTQQNDCRDLLLKHLNRPTLATGHAIASKLQAVTTRRSGLGLLFVITAHDQHGLRVLLSRFPAETGVMAEERGQALTVEFVEKVFMKNARSYKCVLYRCRTVHAGFWDGVAVDRQISDTLGSADYWIREFLESELRNTAAAGTRRVAAAVQTAIRTTDDPAVRRELISATQLMRGRNNRITSAKKMVQELGLSDEAATALKAAFPRPELFGATFKFDVKEFDASIMFRSIELDNGAMLIAENNKFDDVFHPKALDQRGLSTRFTTEGRIVSTKLRKTR